MIIENLIATIWDIIGYFLLAFVIPSFCLKRYSKKWNFTTKFFAFQIVSNLYIAFVMLTLGFLNIVNRVTVFTFIVFLPIGYILYNNKIKVGKRLESYYQITKELENGIYGYSLLRLKFKNYIKTKVQQINQKYGKSIFWEIAIIFIASLWLIFFYGNYKLTNCAYSCADEEVHLYWISELLHNNMFPAGMYPHSFHTLCAVLAFFSPVGIARTYICFSTVTIIMLFISAYVLFRELFNSKYICMISVGYIMLTNIFFPELYSRFLKTLPMEFGIIAAFAMFYFMLQYFSTKEKTHIIMFALSITMTFMVHFYVTLYCAIACICFGIVYFIPLIKRKLLVPFVVAGLCSILLASVPYAVGFVNGYEFEQSIAWAFSVSEVEDEESAEEEDSDEEVLTENEIECEHLMQKLKQDMPLSIRFKICYELFSRYLAINFFVRYKVAGLFVALSIFSIILGSIGAVFKKNREKYLQYLFWGLFFLVSAFEAITLYLGLVVLIEVKRVAVFTSFICIPIFIIPLEFILTMLEKIKIKKFVVEMVLVTLFVVFVLFGNQIRVRRQFSCVITESDMATCLNLVEHGQDHMWTVVSVTNDLSVVRYKGYHYEMVDLVEKLDHEEKGIYIPTPDIYILLEKKYAWMRVIDHTQHLQEFFENNISVENALKDFKDSEESGSGANKFQNAYIDQRDVIMSKIYYWCEGIKKIYPNHIELIYEDEQSCVYKIKQDPYFPLNLNIDYKKYVDL